MKYTFYVQVKAKQHKSSKNYWFQKGKLLTNDNVDYSRDFSSRGRFRTSVKFFKFLDWLDNNHPETVVECEEIRRGKRLFFIIPMGTNWRDFKESFIE